MSLIFPLGQLSRTSRRRLVYPLLALVASVTFGTVGFCLVEGWSLADSLYMTIMTVTTVGYGPPREMSAAGRNFSTLFMVLGVTATGFALSSVVRAFVQSEILATLGARRRQREMSKLHNHFIICGAGRVGARIISEMERAGLPFVVIESHQAMASALAERGVTVLQRDATLDETLRDAGVERARGLAACLSSDADNVYVVLTARDLSKDLYIVARAVEEQAEPKLLKAGANRVVAPIIIGSDRMAQSLIKPALAEFMDSVTAEHLDLGFEEIEVARGSLYDGQKLRFTNIRSELDVVIIAIRPQQGEMVFNPSGETQIEAGDLLIAVGRRGALAELSRLARVPANRK